MKKLVLLLAVFVFGFSSFSNAQNNLPNGDFEGWKLYTPVASAPFWEPTGGFFKTLNILDTIPTPPGVTVYRCDTAHTGTYSARCVTRKIDILSILIPGVVGTISINWLTSAAVLGKPFYWTVKPERFSGYYQSYPLSGDSTGAILLFSKWNSGTKKRDTIAYNRMIFHGTVSSWTKFDTAIQYRNTTVMPDSVTVLLLSCGGYNASNMFGSVGQVGSQALFDDVNITGAGLPPWAVESLFADNVKMSVSPNPAKDYIRVETEKAVKDGVFGVYDTQGRLIAEYTMTEASARFSVGSLQNGMYYYRLRSGGQTVGSGSFIVNR